MEMYRTQKGALHTCDCSRCGQTMHAHEWADADFNDRRDAMEKGTLSCDECGRMVDPATHHETRAYAARYSADGYLDCSPWEFDTNARRLERTLLDLYGARIDALSGRRSQL